MNTRLIEILESIQKDYLKLLKSAYENIHLIDERAVIEEIYVFWYKNKRAIELVLNYGFEPLSAHFFTAASYLSISDKDHFPFLLFGKHHFWDDPLCSYLRIINKSPFKKLNDEFINEIKQTISQNIEVLENLSDHVFILPLRFLFEDIDVITQKAMNIFLQLFEDEIDFETYKNEIITIEDVRKRLSEGVEDLIVFNDSDIYVHDFFERFHKFKEDRIELLGSRICDAQVFFQCVFGYMCQALSVMQISISFNIIPHIRGYVPFRYFSLISYNSSEDFRRVVSKIVLKASLCFIANKVFFEKNHDDFELDDLERVLIDFDFENKVLKEIEDINDLDEIDMNRLIKVFDSKFSELIEKV